MKLKVNEIFYSLQGEGGRAGEPSIFIRLSDCNLSCGFCDTEFESGRTMTEEEILEVISAFPCRWIIWTGGEPGLQLTDELVERFRVLGYKQAIETNGSVKIASGIDYVCISPKVAEHVLRNNFRDRIIDELRYVRNTSQEIPSPSLSAGLYYLSPECNGDRINPQSLKHCIDLCLKNPGWRLSVQQHKLWGVR